MSEALFFLIEMFFRVTFLNLLHRTEEFSATKEEGKKPNLKNYFI